ncbi:MAG: hypothetical protein IH840_05880, partial [Candidatus Heimdallarchaeota archaeon]|nr:hypothetical protein [Candidatus Heimdallarchaeota archaeon]
SAIELPEKRKPVSRLEIPGIPMATATSSTSSKLRQYTITHMLPEKGFRLIIEDSRLNAIINIGRIPKKEKPIKVVESDQGSIILDYYPSEMEYNTNIDQWLQILVNQLELLPVTRLGLFIETLRFIHSCYHSKPDEFQIKQLQTILTSHETYFKLTKPEESRLKPIDAKYGAELTSLMINIIKILTENPRFNLKEIALKLDKDLVYLISTLLIMEQELLIEIKSPIITDT